MVLSCIAILKICLGHIIVGPKKQTKQLNWPTNW